MVGSRNEKRKHCTFDSNNIKLSGYRDSLYKLKEERRLPEGLKGIVRELSFAGDSEKFGGWCFCGTVTK